MSKGHKKQSNSISSSVLKKLKLNSRIQVVENQIKEILESRKSEANFQAGLMFGINGLVDALVGKNIVTMEDIEQSRLKVVSDYRAERVEELRRIEVAKKYGNDPVHYDSTTDKWFVFAPNWSDKVGPFLTREAAQVAKDTIESGSPTVSSDENCQEEATL